MNQQLNGTNKVSSVFNISRLIAIISVITAHTSFNINNPLLYNLIKRFSSIGVVVFIIVSGYYFNPQKYKTIGKFMKSKITTIILPWGFLGTLVFLESKIVMAEPIGISGWLKFMIGHNSYLYYLTVLMICYLIYFYPVKHNKITITVIISFLITIMSQQLTAWGILDIKKIYLTDYLNIFNWVGYFGLGLWLKNIGVYKLLTLFKKYIIAIIALWMGIFIMAYYLDNTTGYFSLFAIPLQVLGAIIVFGISSFDVLNCKLTRYISKISFCVYLLHMAVVPVVYKFIGNIYFIKLLVPLATLAVLSVMLLFFGKIARRLKMEKVFYKLSGIRG